MQKLHFRRKSILNVIKENSTIKQEEISRIIGKSLRTVKTRMIETQEKGLISRKMEKEMESGKFYNKKDDEYFYPSATHQIVLNLLFFS